MNKFFQLIAAVICLAIFNMSLIMLFTFFDIKREFYNEYMNWINVLIIFIVVLPSDRGLLMESIMKIGK